MMSHDVSLYPIKSHNFHGCYPDIAALGWVVPSRTNRDEFSTTETMERYEKNMATFLMVSYQWFISMECWWFISFGMWFGNINGRLIWKNIRFGIWFGTNEIFEGSSWDLTRSFMVLAVHGWKFSPDWPCWDCASPSLMAEGNPQPGFHSPLISPFYPQYSTITPPFFLVKFDGNLAKNEKNVTNGDSTWSFFWDGPTILEASTCLPVSLVSDFFQSFQHGYSTFTASPFKVTSGKLT